MMEKWISYVDAIDALAPSSHFTLGYGEMRIEFWSPAPIAWLVVTKILQLYLLVGMMWYLCMSWVAWEYLSLGVVLVAMYHVGERPERVLNV